MCDSAIQSYNEWCDENNRDVFLPLPRDMHKCTPNCLFFVTKDRVHVCMESRHVHTCSSSCGRVNYESHSLCSLTGKILEKRMENCYWEGTQTLTRQPKKAGRSTKVQKINSIKDILQKLFCSSVREDYERKINLRHLKRDFSKTNKKARLLKLNRSNWHSYFFLSLGCSAARERRTRLSSICIEALSKNIYEFWEQLFPSESFQTRNVVVFVATCISGCVNGEGPMFTCIPWLKSAIDGPVNGVIYTSCLGITSRSMTNMLTLVKKKSEDLGATFPLNF